jgi:hypothetical protein
MSGRLLTRLDEPGNRLADGDLRTNVGRNPCKNSFTGGLHLDDRFVGLYLKQRFAFSDVLALLFLPRQKFAILLRHFERRHHHAYRHKICA